MTRLTDHQLLERFRATHDPAAMNELAQRYIGLVYSAARRQSAREVMGTIRLATSR